LGTISAPEVVTDFRRASFQCDQRGATAAIESTFYCSRASFQCDQRGATAAVEPPLHHIRASFQCDQRGATVAREPISHLSRASLQSGQFFASLHVEITGDSTELHGKSLQATLMEKIHKSLHIDSPLCIDFPSPMNDFIQPLPLLFRQVSLLELLV